MKTVAAFFLVALSLALPSAADAASITFHAPVS
jgi:hypothetical protein